MNTPPCKWIRVLIPSEGYNHPDHIPPLPAISPFLSSDDDTTDSDTPEYTNHQPTQWNPFSLRLPLLTTEITYIPRRRVMILSPGQPIPHGRPYRYHLNGPVHMMTMRKKDALRDRGIDARVVVEAIDRDEIETGVRGPVEELRDTCAVLRVRDLTDLRGHVTYAERVEADVTASIL
ncbi:hypothetical protein Tco_0942063 [Tanacetum coccineum]|uniref:Uncharacterized protein n=1 Tax=Tanacetum coccineum TaxID=301880 RepID=A0ABQ5DUD7_9ASTR